MRPRSLVRASLLLLAALAAPLGAQTVPGAQGVPAAPAAVAAPPENLVAALLAARESIAADPKLNVLEVSRAVSAAVNEASALMQQANYEGAVKRLRQLEIYRPLESFPSYEVHRLLAAAYGRLGERGQSILHGVCAQAMREVLWRRIGSGDTIDDPKRVVMNSEIAEWVRSQQSRVMDVKGRPYKGRDLYEVRYAGPSTGERLAYFELDPRVHEAQKQQLRVFDPIPLAKLRPRDLASLNAAKEKRNRFLDDRSFVYDELLDKVRASVKAATALIAQGKTEDALARLKEVETMRRIEDIPLIDLWSAYSFVQGKLGNTEKQLEMRAAIFGVQQAIAHSGDGASAERAVQVITIDEEYAWLRDKRLTRTKQRLLDRGAGKYDVLTARDASGNERDYYFDVSRVFPRGVESATRGASR